MKLLIRNFRSIQKQDMELAQITVVYGPNGAGKSSLLYALLTLKNIVLNPNQQTSGFFNYQFASLGGFREVVFDHDTNSEVELGITFEHEGFTLDYRVAMKDTAGTFSLEVSHPGGMSLGLRLPVSFPYPGNQQVQEAVSWNGREYIITWNGLMIQTIQPKEPTPEAQKEAQLLAAALNAPAEYLRRVSFVPLRRGFSQPYYSVTVVSPMAITEGEVASLLASDKYLEYKVSHYLEEILNRDLRVRSQIGTSFFSLDCTDNQTGLGVELVNEGFGVNQLIYLLAKALHKDAGLVCIEEPEIHLHPTAVRRLARAMAKMAKEEGKRFLISTHSEPLVVAFLSMVARGELSPSELAYYLVTKERKVSKVERQAINEKGQVEGGLRSFMEGELEEIKAFLGVD